MFIGRYYYTVEAKGRVSLPKPFRTAGKNWIVTRGLDGGLFVFVAEEFEQRLAELANRTFTKKRDRDFLRLMANDAQAVEVDAQGRILLSDTQKKLAGISKDVVILGSYQYIEVWDVDQYHTYLDSVSSKAAEIAEGIELGTESEPAHE